MAKQKYKVEHIIAALKETKGMVYLAADRVGCHADTILNYAKRYKSVQDDDADPEAEWINQTALLNAKM